MLLNYLFYTFLCIFSVCLWRAINWVWLEPRHTERFLRKQGFRGNPYRFFLGDSREIADLYQKAHESVLGIYDDTTTRLMPFLEKTWKTYGDYAYSWIGPKVQVIITDPEQARTIMSRHDIFLKHYKTLNKTIRYVIGSIGLLEGEEWSRFRGKLNPFFNMEKLKELMPAMTNCADNVLNKFMEKMNEDGSGEVDVVKYLVDVSGSLVTECLFHTPYSDEMRRNFLHLREITIIAAIASNPFTVPGSRFFPSKSMRKADEMEKEVRESMTNLVNKRLKDRRQGIENEENDLLDVFLEEIYEDELGGKKKLSKSEKKRIIDDAIFHCKFFFFAAFDTTTNLMVWSMINLAIHQDWQARAREEIFQVLGNGKITYESLSQLKIVNMFLHEVLRLYPAVVEVSRLVEKDTPIGDVVIPKGVLVQVPIGLLQRREDIWGSDARKFNPARFSEGVVKATNGQAGYMPFGWGPRICIGQHLSAMEGKVFLAQLLRTFSIELAPSYQHAPYAAFIIHPQRGAPLLLRKL